MEEECFLIKQTQKRSSKSPHSLDIKLNGVQTIAMKMMTMNNGFLYMFTNFTLMILTNTHTRVHKTFID